MHTSKGKRGVGVAPTLFPRLYQYTLPMCALKTTLSSLRLPLNNPEVQGTLRRIVEEIVLYLTQLIEYIQGETQAQPIPQMYEQIGDLQRKMSVIIQERIEDVRSEMNQRMQMIESSLSNREEAGQRNKLKKERKLMTHNILQRARSFQALASHKSEELLPLTSTNGDSKTQDKFEKLSTELQELNNKITSMQSEVSAIGSFKSKVSSVERDMASMSQKHLGLKLWLQERMESALGGFDGVWKVLSDVQMKVALIDCP